MKKLIKIIPVWTLSVLATLIVIYLSLASSPAGAGLFDFPHSDKVMHGILYCVLTMVYLCDYVRHRLPHHTRFDVELVFAVGAATFGGLLEIAQLVMENGRSYELLDWGADAAGAAIGYLLMKLWLMKAWRHYLLRHKHHYRHRRHHRHHS